MRGAIEIFSSTATIDPGWPAIGRDSPLQDPRSRNRKLKGNPTSQDSLEEASGPQSMRKYVCECVDLEGASGPQSMRSDCPESDSRIVWHLRTFVWHVICITWMSAHRRILLDNAHLATGPSAHCCVRTLRTVGHRVGHVPHGLM